MKIKVSESIITIDRAILTSGEYNIHDVEFKFSKEYENLVKIAVFSSKDKVYKVQILNNKTIIPWEVLTESGDITLGVYGFGEFNNELILRYSPVPITITVEKGSYIEHSDNTEPLTPTDVEQIEMQLNNIDVKTWKVGNKTYIKMTNPDGTSTESVLIDGVDGKDYVITDADYQAIADIVLSDITIPTKLSQLENDADYVKNTDYATSSKGGVVRINGFGLRVGTQSTTEGLLVGNTLTYSGYQTASNDLLIAKGTLENVITGKGLVSNTDYAGNDTAGVIKTNGTSNATAVSSVGLLYAQEKTYAQYQDNLSTKGFISKGTLENVITGKGLVSNTDYANANTGGVMKIRNDLGTSMTNGGAIQGSTRTYEQYNSASTALLICKGTLENVIAKYTTFDTTERAIGSYFGETIYRKCLKLTKAEYNALTTTSSRKVLPLNTNIKSILKADMITNYNDGTKVVTKNYPMHLVNTGNAYDQGCHIYEDGNLQIYVGSSVLSGLTSDIVIELEYTKNV